jgi:hypothetical protein
MYWTGRRTGLDSVACLLTTLWFKVTSDETEKPPRSTMFISAAVNTAQREVRLNYKSGMRRGTKKPVLGQSDWIYPKALCENKGKKRTIAIQSAFYGNISSLFRENPANSLCPFISKGGSCVLTKEQFRSQGCVCPVAEIARHTHTHTHTDTHECIIRISVYTYKHTLVPALTNVDPNAILVVGPWCFAKRSWERMKNE